MGIQFSLLFALPLAARSLDFFRDPVRLVHHVGTRDPAPESGPQSALEAVVGRGHRLRLSIPTAFKKEQALRDDGPGGLVGTGGKMRPRRAVVSAPEPTRTVSAHPPQTPNRPDTSRLTR